jgi:hypothetical protein
VLFYDQIAWRALVPVPRGRFEAIWATICPVPFPAGNAAASVHCSNTYFAGSEMTVARYTLLGTYEILSGP